MELRDWQRRLDEHFTVLRNRRSLDAPDQPIFGLEHGLEDHEVSDLAKAVRAYISNQAPLWDHRLAWIVYAAELGYLFCISNSKLSNLTKANPYPTTYQAF